MSAGDCAAGGLDAGPDEGGALGADSDEEEKRANRAKAAGADQSSRVEGRNQGNNADVSVACPYTDIAARTLSRCARHAPVLSHSTMFPAVIICILQPFSVQATKQEFCE